jgi:hypothetical protein
MARSKWTKTERATVVRAKELLASRIADLPIWVRWYRTYDNPHGGGSFGKSKEDCTAELIGVTVKRLKIKDYAGVHSVDPKNCFFATREIAR